MVGTAVGTPGMVRLSDCYPSRSSHAVSHSCRGAGWCLRTRPAYAAVIRAAADVGGQALNLSDADLAVLAAIAFHQPISRDGLQEVFGHDISRYLIGRLTARDLITTGPRAPRRGAPYTFVTTAAFLAAFGMQSLRDLPDAEQAGDAGLTAL